MLSATKVPAGHQKLIKAKASDWLLKGLALFTPTVDDLDLGMADAVAQTDEDGCLNLIIKNTGYCPVQGIRLGTVEMLSKLIL